MGYFEVLGLANMVVFLGGVCILMILLGYAYLLWINVNNPPLGDS